MNHKSKFPIILVLIAIFTVAGCAKTNMNAMDNATNTAPNVLDEKEKPQVQFQFADIPVPVELNLIRENSMLIRTPSYQGGIVTYEGKVTGRSLEQFFIDNLQKHGWVFQGALSGKSIFLAFSKELGAQCLIKIKESAFNTRVEIWLSEPLGATE